MTESRLSARLIIRIVSFAAIAVGLVAVVLLVSGGKSYDLNLRMADADGIRQDSQVLLDGIAVGQVGTIDVENKSIIVHLELNKKQVTVGQGAHAAIVAANLLGEMYVQLDPGDGSKPVPSGTTLPTSSTTVPTSLDQILDVLDGSTRARLADLLVEAGEAVGGRQQQISDVLRQLPLSVSSATQLLTTMVHDNTTLSTLVSTGNQFIAKVNTQTPQLDHLIDTASAAGQVLANNGNQLQTLVTGLPHTLDTFINVFNNGRNTLAQLKPTLTFVSQAAPELNAVLSNVKPFSSAAVPLLNKAVTVAPTLTRLAERSTPIVKAATPDLDLLSHDATLSTPLMGWLGMPEVANRVFDTLNGWPGAVQGRNAASHEFNGELELDPMIVLNGADHDASAEQRCENLLGITSASILKTIGEVTAARQAHETGCKGLSTTPTSSISGTVHSISSTVAKTLSGVTAGLGSTIGKTLGGVKNLLSGVSAGVSKAVNGATAGVTKVASGVTKAASGIASTLSSGLGKGASGSSKSSSSHASTSATKSTPTQTSTTAALGSLLSYLMGK